jgi:hypothetical protein
LVTAPTRRQLGDDRDDVTCEQVDRRSLLETFDPADDRVDPEVGEPLQLSDQLAGGGPSVVDVERERAGALDAVEVGAGTVALAA